jgi:hypothetical protein
MKNDVREVISNFIRDEFSKIYDENKSRSIWKIQSVRFWDFWENRIMKNGPNLTEDDMIPIIQILDTKGKRRTDLERKVEGAAFTNIYQSTWYDMFRGLKANNNVKNLVDKLFKAGTDTEQTSLLNQIYETNDNVPALTGENAIVQNALLFASNPEKNISVVSLADRYRIVEFFELGDITSIGSLTWAERIVWTRQKILTLGSKIGLKTDARGISVFLYAKEIKRLWRQTVPDVVQKEGKAKISVLQKLQTHAHLVGPLINFRDMDYGPTEENGVIFLFSKITNDLGIKIVSIQKHFPDAEAIKYSEEGKGYKVYIEFEYLSSDFIRHSHLERMKQGESCDLIVCWEHDSKEIPPQIEVLELKEIIKSLPKETM